MVDATKAMKKSFLVPEIKPLDQYDFSRAKILANLTWVLAKSYGAESIPEELKEPYYTDQYDQEHIKPPVIRLLLSSDIYCRVYRNMLQPSEDNAAAPRDNASMLHLLSHQGLAPIDQEKMVKDEDLKQKPIKMGSHLAVIDSLMDAFAKESMNMMRSPGGIEQGPGSWEPQLLHWIDKINRKLQESAERNLNQKHIPDSDGQSPSPIRYRKDKVLPKQTPCFPGITSMKDLANGCAIAATIHYYCPKVLQLEDVCLKETMSVADSLYNLQLIRDFCRDYLSGSCPLALEDLLYVPPVLKVNIGAFLAELFLCFEVLKPDFVCPKEAADMKESPGMNNSPSPLSGNSCGSPVFTFQHPFLSKGHLQSPPQRSTGSLNHSTSLSQVEGFGKTWSKKQLSHPLSQAVSFSIPFGLDSDVDIVMGNPVGMMRSVSSDSLAPNVYPTPKKAIQTTYTPSEDVAWYLGQSGENSLVTTPRTVHKVPMSIKSGSQEEEGAGSPMNNGTLDGHSELPTIEEALQIIHNMETRLLPEGAPDGFYLHSPELKEGPQSPQHSQIHTRQTQGKALAPPTNMGVYKLHSGSINGCNSSAEVPWTSRDDELGLRDNSLDSDVEDISRGLPAGRELSGKEDSTSDPSSLSSQADSSASSGSGVKMTSFAERKKKMASDSKGDGSPKKVQEDTERGMAPSTTTTWAQKAEESPIKSPSLNSEMNQLGARLEEKRRAIEAQKKRIEAIFTKHRQRLGKSAFLQLKKEEEPEGNTGYLDERPLSLEEHLSKVEAEDDLGSLKTSGEKKAQESNITENKDGEVLSKARSDKQVTFSPEIITGTLDVNLGDYNRAVAKLNSALSSLQMDMHRLSDQQQKLMHKEKSKAWIIPAPKATSSPQPSRDITSPRHMDLSSSPSLPRKTSAPAPRSPQPTPRRTSTTTSVNPKSPKHARPAELKIPPLTRVLTPPQNVDTLPHLRKFSPSKVPMQTRSSIHFADEDQDFDLVKALEAENANHAGDTPQCLDQQGNLRPVASVVPQSSTAVVTASGMDSSDGISPQGTKQSNLIEIELSTLQPSEDTGGEGEDSLEDVSLDEPESAHKGGVGFFFKEEKRPEDEMAQRRAALLEKQQKRTEEARRRKQWQETEKEQKKEEASLLQAKEKPQEEEVAGPRRGDFTRQEYMRRQQLKLMDDLDKVLRHKPTTVRAVKKGRPKTVFRDDSVISRSPVRGLLGSKLSKVYSQSTLSLSTVANEPSGNVLSIKRSPRSPRANSPSGLMSPSRLFFTQNGEGDWENASTASSPASIPEYTGPKLYKEPSAKSNKYIIHNALSHCCLAGKVNEPQKNKILEEIEKSKANHFLVLFRDTSCQFRAVYTFSAETEELTRLTGFGPRIISSAMIEGIYKYSSDRKRFTQIPSKTMSMSVDAFTIQGHLWQSKRPTTPKKPGTPK